MIEFSKDFSERLETAENIVFFTGAGISAESGIPTFRGKDGIWNKLNPRELANFNAFLENPRLVWEWYNHRKKIIHDSLPNKGHLAIAEFQNYFASVSVITQNIDNFHARAGSRTVYELHGSIERNYCIKCRTEYNTELDFSSGVPECRCGGLIRPDVVWFGEYLPQDQFKKSEAASVGSDIFFIVGTTAIVYPAASLIFSAKENGAYLAEVNIEETEVSSICDQSFFEKAGTLLPTLIEEIKKIKTAGG
jgi:NAD-dependent deacetylase